MMKIDLEFHFIFDDYGIPFLCLLRFCFIWVQYHDDDLFEQKKSIRARFRNTHRSIFANPQKLELAKAQERRLSQLSQLSGQQQANNNLACSGSENQRIYSLSHYKYPRLSLPQAPIPTSSSSSSIRRSARNSLGSTIVPTIIGPTLATATPTSANSFNTLSSSSSSQNHLSVKQKQKRRNNNLTTSESLSIIF